MSLRGNRLLGTKQVAEILNLSQESVKKFCADGRFGTKIGSSWVIAEADALAFRRKYKRTNKGRPRGTRFA